MAKVSRIGLSVASMSMLFSATSMPVAAQSRTDENSGVVGSNASPSKVYVDLLEIGDSPDYELTDQKLIDFCTKAARPNTDEVGPLLGILISGIANIFISEITTSISKQLAKKIKEVKVTYAGSTNIQNFSVTDPNTGVSTTKELLLADALKTFGKTENAANCIMVQRKVGDTSVSEILLLAEQFDANGHAFTIRPLSVHVAQAAAKTGRNKPIELAVTVGFGAVSKPKSGEASMNVIATQSFVLKNVELGKAYPADKLNEIGTALMPKPPESTPLSIAAAATEIGSDYKKLVAQEKFFNTHKATIEKTLGKLVEKSL